MLFSDMSCVCSFGLWLPFFSPHLPFCSQRQAERVELEKLQRQNTVLTSLCKELKSKLNNTTAVTSAPSAAVSGEAPATVPVDDEDAAAAATTTAPTPAQAEPAAVES